MRSSKKSNSVFKRLARRLFHIPVVRQVAEEVILAATYKRFFPTYVDLPGSKCRMFVDRWETRGRGILMCKSRGQPYLKHLWQRSAALLKPSLVIDVGANYGEFVFSEAYPFAQKIVAIEANQTLIPMLRRSRLSHPNLNQIQIVNALAGRESDRIVDFYVDQHSSGRSTAVRRDDIESIATRIGTLKVDSLFFDMNLEQHSLLFKIDVEGYEGPVLDGMEMLLKGVRQAVGILEFNPKLIALSGCDPNSILQRICACMKIIAVPQQSGPVKVNTGTLDELEKISGQKDFEMDLLVIKCPDVGRIVDDLIG